MNSFRFAEGPLSLKVLITMMLLGIVITYMVLALHIYIDTEFSPKLIGEAYSTFEWIELTDQTHKYFPYYGIYIFAFALLIFVVGTRYSEKLKIFFSIWVPLMIVADIGSMWAIPYISKSIFQWVLFFAGNFLALSFGTIFVLTLYDVWLRKEKS